MIARGFRFVSLRCLHGLFLVEVPESTALTGRYDFNGIAGFQIPI